MKKEFAKPAVLKRLIAGYVDRSPIRVTSLIVTFFGDLVSQHGHSIWAGSLVDALVPLGVGEGLIRTSVFRLVRGDWLEVAAVGRRSYYRLTPHGVHEYERAAHRIYAPQGSSLRQDDALQEEWQLLLPLELKDRDRERFRRSLHWQGFRSIANGVFARPGRGGRAGLLATLEEFDATDRVLVFQAQLPPHNSRQLVGRAVSAGWKLEKVAARYRSFLTTFRPLLAWLRGRVKAGRAIDPQVAFLARLLLIHDYRRILLQDAPLSGDLLPPSWPGAKARALTASIYRILARPSVGYVTTCLQTDGGPMPPPDTDFWARFAEDTDQRLGP